MSEHCSYCNAALAPTDIRCAACGHPAAPAAPEPAQDHSGQPDLFAPPPTPAFVRKARPPVLTSRWWWVAVLVLTLSGGLLWLWAERDQFARDAQWRPTVAAVCGWLGCTLPVWHEPGAFQVTAREVRPHPSVDGVLLITATFRNNAAFEQPWPTLELSLSGLDGELVGVRRFDAHTYLGGEPPGEVLQPGQSAQVTLEVIDADREAVAFAFTFH